jgi:hypothetical protein
METKKGTSKFIVLLGDLTLKVKVKDEGPEPYVLLEPEERQGPFDHLTLPLGPTSKGKSAGFLRPHLTNGSGAQKFRHWLAELLPSQVQEAGRRFGEDLASQYLKELCSVDVEALEQEGFIALAPTDDQVKALYAKHFDGQTFDLRDEAQFEANLMAFVGDGMRLLSELCADVQRPMTITAMRPREDGSCDGLTLHHFPEGFGIPDSPGLLMPPGWYAAPINWFSESRVRAAMRKHFGAGFFRALELVARGLGIPRRLGPGRVPPKAA